MDSHARNGYIDKNYLKLKEFGAIAYTRKDPELLVKCIEHIVQNEPLNFLRDQEENNLSEDSTVKYHFNDTELKIIHFLSRGLSYNEIAEMNELKHLSPRTIETYVLKMVKSLELKNKIHLVSYAYLNGIIYAINGDNLEKAS